MESLLEYWMDPLAEQVDGQAQDEGAEDGEFGDDDDCFLVLRVPKPLRSMAAAIDAEDSVHDDHSAG